MNTLALDHVNKRAEFVMSFTIPFKAVEDPTSQAKCYSPHEVVMAWREVCIKALRMRIDACMENVVPQQGQSDRLGRTWRFV